MPGPLATPVKQPEDETKLSLDFFVAEHGVKTLSILIVIIIFGLLVVGLQHYLAHGTLVTQTQIPFFGLLSLVLVLLRRGHLRLGFIAFLWGMFAVALHTGFVVAGTMSPGLLFLPLAGVMTGWLLGRKHVIAMLIIAGIAIATMVLLQEQGRLPNEPRDPIFWAITYMFTMGIGAYFGLSLTESARREYLRASRLSQELTSLNAALEQKVEQRTAELTQALEHLKRTQEDLIQSEKLASLGAMVAGVSHELNTPIGNIITASSSLSDRAHDLDSAFQLGSLKKSELASGLGGLREMADLIGRSATRAATLVASFKQVAVDQTSDCRREFDLRDAMNDVIKALGPGLKNKPWEIENRIPEGILCDSFPGPLEQIITNLIQNAILHAFSGRGEGRVTLEARVIGSDIELTVGDNGIGMNTATIVHIFDPFFTTKLGQGGSGLGLSICRRLATTVLAGTLNVVSTPDAGSRFILTMPLRTPGKI